jgi:hypothetical protein
MSRRLLSRSGVALSVAAMVLVLNASAVFAGEVTGTGTLLHVTDSKWGTGLHARSDCAYSGQEDLQYFTDDSDATAKADPTRGDPSHAQSWGQIPHDVRDFLTTIGLNPGVACNPTQSTFGAP